MNTVIQVLIAIILVLLVVTAVFTVTDSAVGSADNEVQENSNTLTACLGDGLESENCQLFGSTDDEDD